MYLGIASIMCVCGKGGGMNVALCLSCFCEFIVFTKFENFMVKISSIIFFFPLLSLLGIPIIYIVLILGWLKFYHRSLMLVSLWVSRFFSLGLFFSGYFYFDSFSCYKFTYRFFSSLCHLLLIKSSVFSISF